ncbi:MAG: SMC-Scp complex subunit ScpB [Bacteroidetes bacterium]|nr:SMC-Scp complex subunit ScpB [Bacteroidota bacterium]MCY4233749.1 SMC-Scp complex subunit ScpB [Bacteroidota bacterium]
MSDSKFHHFRNGVTLPMIVETLTFAAETPVSIEQICSIFAEVVPSEPALGAADVEQALELLNSSYEKEGHAFRIQSWAGGLRMTTTAELAPFLEVFFRQERSRRLTKPLMETIAIIAYRQPSTKAEIDAIRGVDSGYAIRKLLSLDLIAIKGRADVAGRPMLYGTTVRFLEQFGLNDLDGLPNLRQAEELLEDVKFDQERLRLLTATELLPQVAESEDQSNDQPLSDDVQSTDLDTESP